MELAYIHPEITRNVSQIIEQIEAKSGASLHYSAPLDYGTKLGINATTIDSVTLLSTQKSNNLYFNRVLGLGLTSQTTIEQIDQILAWYADQRIKRFAIEVSPMAQPSEIANWLEARGFHKSVGPAKLWRDNTPPIAPIETDFHIKRIETEEAADWAALMTTVFRQFRSRKPWFEARVRAQNWHHYLAYDGDEPAAVAAMYTQDGAAHLTDAATLSPFRRRGIQKAMIHRRITDGLALGCSWFTSETAAPKPNSPLVSQRNLRRTDFEIAYIRAKYVYGQA